MTTLGSRHYHYPHFINDIDTNYCDARKGVQDQNKCSDKLLEEKWQRKKINVTSNSKILRFSDVVKNLKIRNLDV